MKTLLTESALPLFEVGSMIPNTEPRNFSRNPWRDFFVSVMALLTGTTTACPGSAQASSEFEFFEKKIRPILVEKCIRCHGPKKQKGGLRLDSKPAWINGGDLGSPIQPGNPDESLLLKAVRYQDADLQMPPKGKLPELVIADFQLWIQNGAPDPRSEPAQTIDPVHESTLEERRKFWCFQPINKPELPSLEDTEWPRTEIDFFILAELETANIRPNSKTDRESLIRRLFFDLTGMPPTPEQIDQFLADSSQNAYEKLIDNLLASRHFGERWGRHWLDVVRYAESSGGGRTLMFPNAWRYRDYVIESFNRDIPYDQFIKEQIAGDLMNSDDWGERRRQLVATAFLVLGPTNYELQDKEILEMDVIDEQLDTIGKAMLGMTIGCARCHDHKFDPISHKDYYGLAGIFKSTKVLIHSNVSAWYETPLPVSPDEEPHYLAHESEMAELNKAIDGIKSELKKMKRQTASSDSLDSLPGIIVDDEQASKTGKWTYSQHTNRFVGKGYHHDGNESKGEKSITFIPELTLSGEYEVQLAYVPGSNRSTKTPVRIHHMDGTTLIKVNQRKTPKIKERLTSLGTFSFSITGEPKVVISNDDTEDGHVIADAVVFINLDERASLNAVLAESTVSEAVKVEDESRKEMNARLLTLEKRLKKTDLIGPKRPKGMTVAEADEISDIPIAIRGVAHNKGSIVPRGFLEVVRLKKTPTIPPDKSGRMELAHWLTDSSNPLTPRVMVNRVWHWLFGQGLVRTVDNFGQTGERPSHPELLDYLANQFIENDWSVKKLIRRILMSQVYLLSTENNPLAMKSDPDNRLLWKMKRKRLDAEGIRDAMLQISGNIQMQAFGSNIKQGTKSEYGYQFDSTRRSVYLPVFRNQLPEVFEVFDFSDPNLQSGKRSTSTIATQALFMMNHPFVMDQARNAATRLTAREGLTTADRIHLAYREVIGRTPTKPEFDLATQFIENNPQGITPWSGLYQVLFQSLDFRYLN